MPSLCSPFKTDPPIPSEVGVESVRTYPSKSNIQTTMIGDLKVKDLKVNPKLTTFIAADFSYPFKSGSKINITGSKIYEQSLSDASKFMDISAIEGKYTTRGGFSTGLQFSKGIFKENKDYTFDEGFTHETYTDITGRDKPWKPKISLGYKTKLGNIFGLKIGKESIMGNVRIKL